MLRTVLVLSLIAAGCGGTDDDAGDLTVSATFTLGSSSGSGTSPFADLVGQTISMDIVLAMSSTSHSFDEGCHRVQTGSDMPVKTASGATAAEVTTNILDPLPAWGAYLEICETAELSTVTLFSDNEAGLAVTLGCHDLPPSALALDGNGDARWTAFEATACGGSTVYDQLHGPLFEANVVTLRVAP